MGGGARRWATLRVVSRVAAAPRRRRDGCDGTAVRGLNRAEFPRDDVEPFHFCTWFEFAPEHASAFDVLLGDLRATTARSRFPSARYTAHAVSCVKETSARGFTELQFRFSTAGAALRTLDRRTKLRRVS